MKLTKWACGVVLDETTAGPIMNGVDEVSNEVIDEAVGSDIDTLQMKS